MPGLQPIAENNQSFTQKPCFVTATVIFNNKCNDRVAQTISPKPCAHKYHRVTPAQPTAAAAGERLRASASITRTSSMLCGSCRSILSSTAVNRRNIGKADIAMQKRGNRLFISRIQRRGRGRPTSNASIASFRHGYRVVRRGEAQIAQLTEVQRFNAGIQSLRPAHGMGDRRAHIRLPAGPARCHPDSEPSSESPTADGSALPSAGPRR